MHLSTDGAANRLGNRFLTGVRAAIENDPFVRAAGREATVPLPQRAIRQPGRWPGYAPPIPSLLTSGQRGADVRVRLYLWIWFTCSVRGFSTQPIRRTTGDWAVLLNLCPDVSSPRIRAIAARRVARAAAFLKEQELIGRPREGEWRLLDPTGSGDPYQPWTSDQATEREHRWLKYEQQWGLAADRRRTPVWEERPIDLPVQLWTNGSVSILSGRALAVLIVLLDYEQRLGSDGGDFRVPKSRPYEYPLSHHVWQDGTEELALLGYVLKRKGERIFRADPSDPRRATDRHRTSWRIDHRNRVRAARLDHLF